MQDRVVVTLIYLISSLVVVVGEPKREAKEEPRMYSLPLKYLLKTYIMEKLLKSPSIEIEFATSVKEKAALKYKLVVNVEGKGW